MPDLTSTLLAMYQQVIGGSSAREQASVEAECARRVITSGLTIAGTGAITIPGTVVVGTLTVNGSFSLLGTLTVGTLAVTGNASVTGNLTVGTLSVTGNATLWSLNVTNLASVGSLGVTGVATVGGLLTASAGLSVTGTAGVTGTLNVNGAGPHTIVAANIVTVQIAHQVAGSANYSQLALGTDITAGMAALQAFSSTFASAGFNVAQGFTVSNVGSGGISVVTTQASAAIRFYTNSAERMRILPGGDVVIGVTAQIGGAIALGVAADSAVRVPLIVQNIGSGNTGNLITFCNNAVGVCGSITQTAAGTIAYVTTSDARLKTDDGLATDLAALRALRVHDFRWTDEDVPDRGVFAQEVQPLMPRAVVSGTDERTPSGTLARPWMTDYSKFVPDLIVGWQQHEAELAAWRAERIGHAER